MAKEKGRGFPWIGRELLELLTDESPAVLEEYNLFLSNRTAYLSDKIIYYPDIIRLQEEFGPHFSKRREFSLAILEILQKNGFISPLQWNLSLEDFLATLDGLIIIEEFGLKETLEQMTWSADTLLPDWCDQVNGLLEESGYRLVHLRAKFFHSSFLCICDEESLSDVIELAGWFKFYIDLSCEG